MSDRENPSRDEERARNDAEDAGVTTNLELAKMIAAQVERVNEWERRRLARARTTQKQELIHRQAQERIARIYDRGGAALREANERTRPEAGTRPRHSSSVASRTAKTTRTRPTGRAAAAKDTPPSTTSQQPSPRAGKITSLRDPRRPATGRVSGPSPMSPPTPSVSSAGDDWMPRKQIKRRVDTIPEADRNRETENFLNLLDAYEADYARAAVTAKYDPSLSKEQKEQARREYGQAMRDIDKAYERVKAGESAKAVKSDYLARPSDGVLEDEVDTIHEHRQASRRLRFQWDRTSSTVKQIANAGDEERIRAQWDALRPSSDGMSTDGPENDGIFSAYFDQDVKGKQPEMAPAAPPKPPAPSLKDTIDWKIMGSRMKVITSEDNGTITLGKEVEASDAQGQTPAYGLHEENDRKALSRLADLVGVGIRNLGNPDDTERKKPFNPFGGDPTVSRADIPFGPVQVRAYEKSDGTKVKGHERRRPGQDKKK